MQLGQIVDDDDATCDGPNRGVFQYVEVKEHRMLLSQRREMPQLHVDKRDEHARITFVPYFCTMCNVFKVQVFQV